MSVLTKISDPKEAKYKVVYKPRSISGFCYKLYRKGLFGWWWNRHSSASESRIYDLMKIDEELNNRKYREEYYK